MLIADRNGMMVGGEKLPPGVKKVQYLESTGAQYINTGLYANETTGFRITMQVPQANQNWKTIIGGRGWPTNSTAQFQLQLQNDYCPYGRFGIGLNPNNKELINMTSENAIIGNCQFEYIVSGTTGIVKVNGVQIASHNTEPVWTLRVPITLFAGIMNQNEVAEYATGLRIGTCEILNGNLVLQSLISVSVNAVGYMYDKVSNTLFGNQGTGSFIIGPDVAGGGGGIN